MKECTLRALAWALIVLLALGVVTDAICALGLPRGWQYIYNFAAFLAMPFLLVVALKKDEV